MAEKQNIPDPVTANLTVVRHKIAEAARRCGRASSDIALIVAAKTQGPARLRPLLEHGQISFGENYVQEALDKQAALPGQNLDWHLIGHLQKNKVRLVVGRFSFIHTLDSINLAELLHKALDKDGDGVKRPQKVLIQVNLADETTKHGCAEKDLLRLAEAACALPLLELRGLMCLPPYTADSRPYFSRLRHLRDELERKLGRTLPHLSMGMSHDYEQAIEEGASMVRVGTAIFGPRLKQA